MLNNFFVLFIISYAVKAYSAPAGSAGIHALSSLPGNSGKVARGLPFGAGDGNPLDIFNGVEGPLEAGILDGLPGDIVSGTIQGAGHVLRETTEIVADPATGERLNL